ncbi:MAG: phosphatidylserine decarboxylase [Blautia sp.]|nr:phosphatidylserine decarboxylase [Blautia sp.]
MDLAKLLYDRPWGEALMNLLSYPPLSRAAGRFLDSRLSMGLIPPFVRATKISLEDYDLRGIDSFNAFFRRRIKKGRRPVEETPEVMIAPCDGLLRAYRVKGDTVFPVKEKPYTLTSLLRSEKLSRRYEGGYILIYRLCVDNYHRYAYVDSGRKSKNVHLPGMLYTVRPAALRKRPVLAENSREYTLIQSESFGPLLQMEVGAMFVGRIVNHEGAGYARRGQEKGMFEYGGSTVIVLVRKGRLCLREDIEEASKEGRETPVRLGEAVGRALSQGENKG